MKDKLHLALVKTQTSNMNQTAYSKESKSVDSAQKLEQMMAILQKLETKIDKLQKEVERIGALHEPIIK
ncbi:MAG: hypothetical protein AAFY71_10060 [Bacteroidota bacterium]